jgi:hypothetical protein
VASTGGSARAEYLLRSRKTTPLWGKLTEKVPAVAAADGRIAARQGLTEDLST